MASGQSADYAMTMEQIDRARYILLTTFKRDGTPVSSPVWITGSAGTYEFTTGEKAWKARRLRADARVHVQACNLRGRPLPESDEYTGTGEVLVDPTDVAQTERALTAKYGWQFRATKVSDRLHSMFSRNDPRPVVAIRLTLADASPEI
jgi:uncharacterized protein